MDTILLIDNYDSFTYNIYSLIFTALKKNRNKSFNVVIIKNDDKTLLEVLKINPSHIIFGPGQGTVYRKKDIGISEEILEEFKDKSKILGICLGHQLIYKFFGGKIIVANEIMHGKEDMTNIKNNFSIFDELPEKIKIMRYHSQIGDPNSLPNNLEIIAQTSNIIMGIKHKYLNIWGLQFHPESIGTPDGMKIISNFLKN